MRRAASKHLKKRRAAVFTAVKAGMGLFFTGRWAWTKEMRRRGGEEGLIDSFSYVYV